MRLLYLLRERYGFDVVAFLADGEAARSMARRVVARLIGEGKTPAALGNYVRLLAALRDYAGHDFKVQYPKVPRGEPKAYTPAEFAALRDFRCPENPFIERQMRAIMAFGFYTAMRPGEVVMASVGDLDPQASRVFVRYPEKGGAKRWLPVEREMWSPHRPFGSWMRRVTGPLWQNQLGEPLTAATVRAWMARYVKPATGVEATMHRFRHTRAVALHKAGLRTVFIKEYLGHAKLETTWHYLQALVPGLEAAFQEVKLPGMHLAVGD